MLCKTYLCLYIIFISYELTKSHNLMESDFMSNLTLTSNRSARVYFPIFQMIEFQNEGCLTVDGLMGTCYSRTECDLFGGITRGFCARGFGVCCFFHLTCGGAVIHNRTHFLNPKFPNTFNEEMRCQISVSLPTDACQLRIDFKRFLISNPKNSLCIVDALSIPHPFNLPVLCGNLTGQHIYMEGNEVRELLIIITTTGQRRHRYWVIEIQFIQCDLTIRGCLQYYTGINGLIKSMNFDCFQYIRNNEDDRECLMAGLEYTACIRLESQRCAIQWTAQHFDIGPSGVFGSQRGDFCQQNYITISNAKIVTTDLFKQNLKSFDRFCGTALNIDRGNKTSIPLISRVKPFTVGVTTAKQFVGRNKGVSLSWEQKVCIDAIV